MGLARCGTVFPVSAVVGVAVPAAVCRWGLARAVLVWGGVSGVNIIIGGAASDAAPRVRMRVARMPMTNRTPI